MPSANGRRSEHLAGGDESVDRDETALISLLKQHPDARVGAVRYDAAAITAIPPSVPIPAGQPRVSGQSLIEIVAMSDRSLVARLWWQARGSGTAGATIRLLEEDCPRATLTFFDLRARHGVLVAVLVAEAADSPGTGATPLKTAKGPSPLARLVKDGTALILDADAGTEQLLGWTRDELVGRRTLELIHPDDHESAIDHWVQMLEHPGPSRPVRLRHRHRDGAWIWVEVTNHSRLDDPVHPDVVADMVDVTEEMSAAEAVRARQQLLEQVTETVPIGLLHANLKGQLLYGNYRLTEITGLHAGALLTDWPEVTSAHDRAVIRCALESALGGAHDGCIVQLVGPDGDPRHCSMSLRPLLDHRGTVTGVTGSVEDVTTSVVERRELEMRAATDALTSCLNRTATMAVIQEQLDALAGDDDSDGLAVIFVDVDNLKDVNDRLGHSAGDALLVEVATRLRASVRTRDTVGRFGGDEFVVVAGSVSSAEHSMSVARWVASRVIRSFVFDAEVVQIRASLGVAWTGRSGVQASWLVRQADGAMYASKRRGLCDPVLAAS